MDNNAGKDQAKPADKQIHEGVDDILHASREQAGLSHKVMDIMLHAQPSDREDFQNVTIKQLAKIARSTGSVDNQQLHNLVLDDKTPGEKKTAAIAYELAAANSSNKGDQINKMAAAILSDQKIAKEIKDGHIQDEQKVGHATIGRASGLAASAGTYLGVKGILAAQQSLPLPPAAKALLAAGSAVLAGGVLNNVLSHRELSSSVGFLETGMDSAGIAAASWLLTSRFDGAMLKGTVGSMPFEISQRIGSSAVIAGALSSIGVIDGNQRLSNANQYDSNFGKAMEKAAQFKQASLDAGANATEPPSLSKLADRFKAMQPDVTVPEWPRLDKRFEEFNPNR